jgi:hypothetical protein
MFLVAFWLGATCAQMLMVLGIGWLLRKARMYSLELACALTVLASITLYTLTSGDLTLAFLGYVPPITVIYLINKLNNRRAQMVTVAILQRLSARADAAASGCETGV